MTGVGQITAGGLRVTAIFGGMVDMRCVSCNRRYIAPLGAEDRVVCKTPACIKKRRAE
jgi:hypothetical protein